MKWQSRERKHILVREEFSGGVMALKYRFKEKEIKTERSNL